MERTNIAGQITEVTEQIEPGVAGPLTNKAPVKDVIKQTAEELERLIIIAKETMKVMANELKGVQHYSEEMRAACLRGEEVLGQVDAVLEQLKAELEALLDNLRAAFLFEQEVTERMEQLTFCWERMDITEIVEHQTHFMERMTPLERTE